MTLTPVTRASLTLPLLGTLEPLLKRVRKITALGCFTTKPYINKEESRKYREVASLNKVISYTFLLLCLFHRCRS